MTPGIGPIFRRTKEERNTRPRQTRLQKAAMTLGAMLLIGAAVGIYCFHDGWFVSDEDEELQFAWDAEDTPTGDGIYIPAIVDLAGDPMWIKFAQDEGTGRVRTLARPEGLNDPGISPQIAILNDTMISVSERFMTAIPSTQRDFAFFQVRQAAFPSQSMPFSSPVVLSLETSLAGNAAAAQGEDEQTAFARQLFENGTSMLMVSPESERFLPTKDMFVKILAGRTLGNVVLEGRFSPGDAQEADAAMKTLFGRDELDAGFVVALRGFRTGHNQPLRLVQLSIYANDAFIGTLARDDTGKFVSGADPWVHDDLFNYSGEMPQGVKRQYRLLDAIYSTAVRNNVPTAVIGEAIMYLSRSHDLNAFATATDRLTLVYSHTPRGNGNAGGRALYIGVQGAEKSVECFVFAQTDRDYACVSGNDFLRTIALAHDMTVPVNGVLTSSFGPRRHPVLKTVRVHKGIDWAAPAGAMVLAALDGKVAFMGDRGDYGNLVRLSHADGRETRYAHLSRFAGNLKTGDNVKAGDMIGYVGTTGLSSGPHLHFELYHGEEAVDPLETMMPSMGSGNAAVEILVDRIIRVESGGKPRAKNPLSSATGLGQFISSTWIRMMNSYRPDLARSLSREELLALRFDPTISREMVRNLAHESEAYLRARGHRITAGRLYLAHFLGADGAHRILSSPGGASLANVLGRGVISANPFLTGKDARYVIDWAERKIQVKGYRIPKATKIQQTSPEFEQYKTTLIAILEKQDSFTGDDTKEIDK